MQPPQFDVGIEYEFSFHRPLLHQSRNGSSFLGTSAESVSESG